MEAAAQPQLVIGQSIMGPLSFSITVNTTVGYTKEDIVNSVMNIDGVAHVFGDFLSGKSKFDVVIANKLFDAEIIKRQTEIRLMRLLMSTDIFSLAGLAVADLRKVHADYYVVAFNRQIWGQTLLNALRTAKGIRAAEIVDNGMAIAINSSLTKPRLQAKIKSIIGKPTVEGTTPEPTQPLAPPQAFRDTKRETTNIQISVATNRRLTDAQERELKVLLNNSVTGAGLTRIDRGGYEVTMLTNRGQDSRRDSCAEQATQIVQNFLSTRE